MTSMTKEVIEIAFRDKVSRLWTHSSSFWFVDQLFCKDEDNLPFDRTQGWEKEYAWVKGAS